MACKVGVVKDEHLLAYSFPSPHPLTGRRIQAFYSALDGYPYRNELIEVKGRRADDEELLSFHTRSYLELVKTKSLTGEGYLDYGDTPAFKGVYEAASYSVGSTLMLADMIMEGTIEHGFNPLGGLHHAKASSASGFCVFNDAAILIKYLHSKFHLNRILYVDIDAHHGDGVFYAFEDVPWLSIIDIHEDGRYLYPGTGFPDEEGKGEGLGKKLNVTLPPGSGDSEFEIAFMKTMDFAEQSDPEFVVMQAGADGLHGDPLTHLNYTARTHRVAASRLHRLAHDYAHGRMVALGGGGYNIDNVAEAWLEVVTAMLGNKLSHGE
ncbi:MAG: acetoin utilization protein AcuC [Nitrososphaerota archaeon]